MKKKNVFLLGMLAMALALGFVGCAVNIALTPAETFNDPGYFAVGDTVGVLKNEDPKYEWRFSLISGEGDTDNNLFEIKNDNTLVAKRRLPAKEYSVRVNMRGINQDQGGIQRVFTFTVNKEIQFPENFYGTWVSPPRSEQLGTSSSYFQHPQKTLVIAGSNLNADLGTQMGTLYKANFVLASISGDRYTLELKDGDFGLLGEQKIPIKFVDGNIVIDAFAEDDPANMWSGTFRKQ